MPTLPHKIIVDILSRLPVKSLCRFRCVSKPWRTIISEPHFAKTHLDRTQHERLILIDGEIYTVEYKQSPSDNVAMAVELNFPCLKSPIEWIGILGSCDGLLLVAGEADTYFLLNPSTRESRELPKSPFGADPFDGFSVYGLGYDSSIDDYKLVKFFCYDEDDEDEDEDEDEGEDVCSESIVSVYTLRTNSWRRIEDNPFCQFVHDLSHMVFLNGALHWLASGRRGSSLSGMIARLDLVDEKFKDVPPPSFVQNIAQHWLGVLGGCLCVLASSNGYRCDVCVMKEYGVRESWTKFTITVPDVTVEPLCFPNNGEIMWVCGGKLNVYNPNGKTFRDVVIRGIPAPFEVGIYVESIVSPNYSSRIDTIAASQVQDNPNAMTNVKSSRCRRRAAPTDLPARKEARSELIGDALHAWAEALKEKAKTERAKAKWYKGRSKSTKASSTTDDPFSFTNCVGCLDGMGMIDDDTYIKALEKFMDPVWREMFARMPLYMKTAWLGTL